MKNKKKRKSLSFNEFKDEYLSSELVDQVKDWCIDNVESIFERTPSLEELLNYKPK